MSFVLSKILSPLAVPSNLVILAIVLGAFLALGGRRRLGRILVGAGIAGLLVAMLLPVGLWLSLPLEFRFPAPAVLPGQVDGIVVLGGGVTKSEMPVLGGAQLNEAADRLSALVILARRFPEARIVYTGGNATIAGGPREADVAAALLSEMGVAGPRLHFERESRNTHENAVTTKAMMAPQPGETWLLVTSALHMPRSMGAFRRQGWDPVPVPVDFLSDGEFKLIGLPGPPIARLGGIDWAAREWVGLLYYRLLGYTDALLPAPATSPGPGT